jgi:predicted metal-dependent peptidase
VEDQFLKEFKDDLDLIFCKYTIHFPFWAVLAERCSFSLTKSKVPTAAVDKFGHILFNIDFIKNLKSKYKSQYIKKLLFVIAHEISHFAFEFFDRLGKRDLKLFNVAHDYAINLLLYYQFEKNMEYVIPECLLNESFKDMCAEEIYEKIKNNFSKSFVVDVFEDFGFGANDQESEQENKILIRKRRVELPSKESKTQEEFEEEFKNYMQSAMNDAYTLAKSQGLMPADMERVILRNLKPKIDWLSAFRQKLRFGISRVEKRDTTWHMPNRRFLETNYIFPSSIGPESPKIAYAVDTSGSMSQADIDQAMSELEEIRRKFQAKIYLLDCDSDIHNSRWLNYFEPLPRLKGGGGTDFRPVFEHLDNKRINPDYCVFFTDGMGEFGQKPNMAYNILWILTTDAKPPFGECIRINVPNE